MEVPKIKKNNVKDPISKSLDQVEQMFKPIPKHQGSEPNSLNYISLTHKFANFGWNIIVPIEAYLDVNGKPVDGTSEEALTAMIGPVVHMGNQKFEVFIEDVNAVSLRN